ncbi:unnamed protein product, partial [Didymodactylos carnosus]
MSLIDNNYHTSSYCSQILHDGTETKRRSKSIIDKTPQKRRTETNKIIYTLANTLQLSDECKPPINNRNNKNDVLGLTITRLIKAKYLDGDQYSKNVALIDGIKIGSEHIHGFVIVLRRDGRVITFSDNVEQYLGKPVRTLYTQCINIYDCLDSVDRKKLKKILSTSTNIESEKTLLCTWRLPKGKRPSRAHLDERTILMNGHFYSANQFDEPLFIARCECVLSTKTNLSADVHILKFTLLEDLTIQQVTSNVRDILGYSPSDMINKSLTRFIVSSDFNELECTRIKCVTQLPHTTMCVMDAYTKNGDRLSVLCNWRMTCERRNKLIKIVITAQII